MAENETRFSYHRRLASGLQRYSPEWRDSDLYRLPPDAMDHAEAAILAATAAAVADKTRGDSPTGGLREIRRADASGREIVDFAGDPLSWMNKCMWPAKAVKRFRNPATVAAMLPSRRSL